MINFIKSKRSIIATLLAVGLMVFSFYGGCLCDEEEIDIVQSDDTSGNSGIVFDENATVDLPDDVSLVFPEKVTLNDDIPENMIASDSEVDIPTADDYEGTVTIFPNFDCFSQDSFAEKIGKDVNKLLAKLGYSVGTFADDLLLKVQEYFPELKLNEGSFVELIDANIPYIETNLDLRTFVQLVRPGDGTYVLTIGLGEISVGDIWGMDFNLLKMKWQPNSNFEFVGYIAVNTELINLVLQAACGVSIPFNRARIDFNFQSGQESVVVWLRGISDLPSEIPEFLAFKNARVGFEALSAGLRIRATLEGINQPSWMGIVESLSGVSMLDPKMKFVAYGEDAGPGAIAVKLEDYGIAGETPIFHEELLISVEAGARVYWDAADSSMGIQLQVANPVIRYGSWEQSFGSMLTWVIDELLGIDNWLSSSIKPIMDARITEVNFYDSAVPDDADAFWDLNCCE